MGIKGRPKSLENPERLNQLFDIYKSKNKHEEISLTSFLNFTKSTFGIYLSPYFENRSNSYILFQNAINNIRSEIFNNKMNLYKSGKLHHQKICKDLYDKGLSFNDINNEKFILKNIPGEFPYQSCKKGITIKDTYLKKITNQAKNMTYKKPPNEIYVINIKGSNIYKIGVSSNSQRRIYDLRAANAFPIDVIYVQKSLFPAQLERKIHNHLSDKHIKNEWFKIDDIDIVLGIIKKG